MVDQAKHQNWVKSSLSLRLVKDGLITFSNEKADSLRDSIQKDVEIKCKAAVQVACTKCTSKSVRKAKTGQYYMNCPTCNHWITTIQQHAKANHRLEWSNSDPQKWSSRSWEIVKIFMTYGCEGSRSAQDIDCSNLLTMMLGCEYFHQFITSTTILKEIKDIRNSVMHSGSLELTDEEMKNHLDKMIELLEDQKYLKHERTCREAVEQIKQLRDDTVSKKDENAEIVRMISEIHKEVEDLNKRKDLITVDVLQLSDKQDSFLELHQELDKDLHDNIAAIEKKQTVSSDLLDTIKTLELPGIGTRLQTIGDNLKALKEDTSHNILRLQDKFKAMDLKQNQIENRQNLHEQQIGRMGLNQIRLEQRLNVNERKISHMDKKQGKLRAVVQRIKQILKIGEAPVFYEDRKLKLQRHLIELYQNDHSSITVYPLRPNLTKELDTMFVRQEMIEKNPRGPTTPQPDINDKLEHTRGQEVIKIQTLNEVFFKEAKLCKNIYVTGDAGVGKSTFCRYIVNMWIKAQTGKNVKSLSDLKARDVEMMKQFPFLFYVQLRGVMLGTETDTFASLIKTQLNLDNDLEDFLKEENCLIICDSLDEIASGLPSRGVLDKSTRLITTRPWKLETLQEEIEGKAIDKQIEIVCIGENSAETLVKNLLPVLIEESPCDSEKDYKKFLQEMKEKRLMPFLRIPVLLVQILCLWYEDNLEVGESQSSIYKKLVHYQIMIFVKKSKNYAQLSYDNYTLLVCKSKTCPCTNFSDILLKVGKLAFNALVSENRQYELVFDHKTTEFYGLCDQDVKICLRIGILSQHKLFWKLTEEPKKFMSFVHKTNQEFFAALYLSHKVPISDIKSVLNTAICNLDRMLELEKILMFVSGLNPVMGRKMADLLLKAADQDPRIQEYRQTAGWSPHDKLVSNIQTAILAACTECEQHQHQQQFRLDDVRVDKDNMSRVLSCLPAGSQVTSISMEGDFYIPTDGVMRHINTSRLQKVNLYRCTISRNSLSLVVSSSLCSLYLFRVRMSHAALESLGSRLSAAVNLRWVGLEWLKCETHGRLEEGKCAPLSLNFSNHVGLEWLVIMGCVMSSCRMAPGMGKLEIVNLFLLTTTAAILKQLVDSLPGNNVEVTLHEVAIRHDAGAATPAAILHDIRQSCRVVLDRVERRRGNGDLLVNNFVFYK